LTTPDHTTQETALEALWRRAEEIRALCGLPSLTDPDARRSPLRRDSAESLVELLLGDLESNFRRELATRVQLEGLGELMTFAIRDPEPDRPYQVLLQYLARALNEPNLWLGMLRGNPPGFTLYRAWNATGAERVSLREVDPEWLRWILLGEGEPTLAADPWGRHRGGPWHVTPIKGDMPVDRLSGGSPVCPGSRVESGPCALTGAPLEDLVGGHRRCSPCQLGRIVGLMGIVANACLNEGGRVIGVIPQALADREVAHTGLTELRIVGSMHERKALMADLSDAFMSLPGGFGTWEEFFEVLTWSQLGIQRKACGLLNVDGYYDPLLGMADRAYSEGFVREAHRDLLLSDTDPERLLDRLSSYTAPATDKGMSRPER